MTFHVCDWCGEPVEKPIVITAIGGDPFVCRRDTGHYHNACFTAAYAALSAAEEANKIKDAPTTLSAAIEEAAAEEDPPEDASDRKIG